MKRWSALLLLCGLAWGQGYVVQPGDTLERIARLFQVSVADLMMRNGLLEDPLPAGLELEIPASDWDSMNLEVLPLLEPEPAAPVAEAMPWVFIRPPRAPEAPSPPAAAVRAQRGWASWYGPRFHGRRTANGERFNKFHLTAAHRTLPFNTRVRVTNLQNGRSIVVRINDRGPYIRGRIIDLSYAAARRLGMHRQGIIQVKVEILD
ncbi:MAG: septal ring lytic transglycosylase RlpA family protein [Meiothermus sp.]|uniref:septal ring lytic transglycosylase RlpA family protein n=1 Tax=Meiothermus sp. TaxID=1955249 RepID=UPI0025EC1D8D|nr:septal ring lytic transglycosylase RlpA family protein [Meiothermus sp.]MCS7068403.1 septal ring lytic transglycosylase RlpA family protein [Meiothermus sp.]MDW8426623.1 septal ring lytic transglycosylase RlpA family protein [Meiothermus sp.]